MHTDGQYFECTSGTDWKWFGNYLYILRTKLEEYYRSMALITRKPTKSSKQLGEFRKRVFDVQKGTTDPCPPICFDQLTKGLVPNAYKADLVRP